MIRSADITSSPLLLFPIPMLCPICKKPVLEPKEGERNYSPFCSERCKLIDLGRWLNGTYQIPVKDDDEAHDGERDASDRDEQSLP